MRRGWFQFDKAHTTPVFFPGKMYDWITLSLPPTVGSVGWNCGGRPTALLVDLSTILALGFLRVLKLGTTLLVTATLLSTPLVALLAAQLLTQLKNNEQQHRTWGDKPRTMTPGL